MKELLTGNFAAAYGCKLSRAQIVSAYPITPHTEVIEKIAEMCAQGEMDATFVNVESEHSVMMLLYGAALNGARVFTSTSSQGLLYMHEGLHWVAGARMPIVMTNIHRAPGTPWNLDSDQRDSLSQRDTGWMHVFCESAQDVLDSVIQGYKVAEAERLPWMVSCDAFYLSHTYEVLEIPEQEKVDAYLGEYEAKIDFSPEYPGNYNGGLLQNLWKYSQRKQRSMDKALELVKSTGEEYYEMFGRRLGPLEAVQTDDADTVIVTSDTITRTVRCLLPTLRKHGFQVGLMKMRLLRPFPVEEVKAILSNENIKNIIVFDRNISAGMGGIFCQEIRAAMYGSKHQPRMFNVNVCDGVDVPPEMIVKAVEYVQQHKGERGEMIWGAELI